MVRAPSVVRWQLVFMGTVTTLVVFVVGFRSQMLAVPSFTAGIVLAVAATVLALVVAWERLPSAAAVTIPLVNTLAVGLLDSGPDVRLGMLWLFPTIWIATYYPAWVTAAQMALIAALIIAVSRGYSDLPAMIVRVMVIVLSLTFLATTVRIGARRGKASRLLVGRESARTVRAAERAEAHRRQVTQIIDVLHTALAAVAADGTIVNRNDAYARLYGLGSADPLLPALAVEYDDFQGEAIPPERISRSRAARGETLRAERVWLFDQNRRWRALEVTTEPLTSAAGDPPATLLIIDDITERLAADTQRREMTAVISHELRNPLTAILGHLELAQERTDLPEGMSKTLGVMERAGMRMQQLVSHILDESRDVVTALAEPVDLRQLADAAVEAFTPTATAGELAIQVVGAETLRVVGDAFRLRQALDNLLSNAVKYTPAGGEVTIRLTHGAGGFAELAIIDTGVGISAAELPHIFDQFYRAELAMRGTSVGAGLGMGIAQSIITEHGGTLDVTSALGEGTTVTLRFPALDETTARPDRKQNP